MSQVYEILHEIDGEGLIAYQNVVSENPTFHARLGDYYHFSAGENEKALFHYKKGHKLLPNEPFFIEKIAIIASYIDLFSTASDFYKKLEKHRSLSQPEMRQAAWASQSAKKYPRAIRYWEELTQIAPLDTNILVNLGFCYGKIDNSEKALECSKKAYNINPHDYVVVPYEPFFCQNIYIKMAFSALFYWKNTIKGMIKIARFCKIFQKALQSMRKIRTIQSQYSK
jgi:tetratricopeptide (TPR) repeat protein